MLGQPSSICPGTILCDAPGLSQRARGGGLPGKGRRAREGGKGDRWMTGCSPEGREAPMLAILGGSGLHLNFFDFCIVSRAITAHRL